MQRKTRQKPKFVSDTPLSLMGTCQAIMDDNNLTFAERHQQINRLRREIIRKYGFFSAEVRTVDRFIEQHIKAAEREQQSRTRAV